MNTSLNLRTLVFVAIGIYIITPAISAPVSAKLYIIRQLKTAVEGDFLVGVETKVRENGEVVAALVFTVETEIWDSYAKHQVSETLIIEEVSIEQVPVTGLFAIINYRSDLYSDVLPTLLSKSTPKKVVENLSGDLFRTLTPEAKEKISHENLAELMKLYG